MLDIENKKNEFYISSLGGRKSGYLKAKELLLKMYVNNEKVEISELAKVLRVTYTTARNYLFRFLTEELGEKDLPNFYQYKK